MLLLILKNDKLTYIDKKIKNTNYKKRKVI